MKPQVLMLSSSRQGSEDYLEHAKPFIFAHLGDARELLFVPFAGVSMSWDAYCEKVAAALPEFTVTGLHQHNDPAQALANAKKNGQAIVVGGGNTAVEEALYLTNHANKVTLIHRRDTLRAEKILQERLFKHDRIEIIWDTAVDEVIGDEDPLGVTGVKLRNIKTDTVTDIAVDGLFIAIGHDPATQLFKGKLKMDDEGYLTTAPDSTLTSIDGVFAAGDVQDKTYRQAVTAAGTGCMAALEAEKFIAELESASLQTAG